MSLVVFAITALLVLLIIVVLVQNQNKNKNTEGFEVRTFDEIVVDWAPRNLNATIGENAEWSLKSTCRIATEDETVPGWKDRVYEFGNLPHFENIPKYPYPSACVVRRFGGSNCDIYDSTHPNVSIQSQEISPSQCLVRFDVIGGGNGPDVSRDLDDYSRKQYDNYLFNSQIENIKSRGSVKNELQRWYDNEGSSKLTSVRQDIERINNNELSFQQDLTNANQIKSELEAQYREISDSNTTLRERNSLETNRAKLFERNLITYSNAKTSNVNLNTELNQIEIPSLLSTQENLLGAVNSMSASLYKRCSVYGEPLPKDVPPAFSYSNWLIDVDLTDSDRQQIGSTGTATDATQCALKCAINKACESATFVKDQNGRCSLFASVKSQRDALPGAMSWVKFTPTAQQLRHAEGTPYSDDSIVTGGLYSLNLDASDSQKCKEMCVLNPACGASEFNPNVKSLLGSCRHVFGGGIGVSKAETRSQAGAQVWVKERASSEPLGAASLKLDGKWNVPDTPGAVAVISGSSGVILKDKSLLLDTFKVTDSSQQQTSQQQTSQQQTSQQQTSQQQSSQQQSSQQQRTTTNSQVNSRSFTITFRSNSQSMTAVASQGGCLGATKLEIFGRSTWTRATGS